MTITDSARIKVIETRPKLLKGQVESSDQIANRSVKSAQLYALDDLILSVMRTKFVEL